MKILLILEFIGLTAAAVWKHDWFAAAAGVLIPVAALLRTLFVWDKARRTAIVDVAAVLEGFLLAWQLVTSNRPLLDPVYFPALDTVLRQFFSGLVVAGKGTEEFRFHGEVFHKLRGQFHEVPIDVCA